MITFFEFTKLQLTEDGQKQENCQLDPKPNITLSFIHPTNGKIITKEEYIKYTQNETKTVSSNKRKYPTSLPISSNDQPIKRSSLPNNSNDSTKLFSNWSNDKLDEEIKRLQIEVEKIENENESEEEIEKYDDLATKWKKISQDAVYSLIELFPQNNYEQKNTVKSVIQNFKIDPDLIEYDEDNDCFKD